MVSATSSSPFHISSHLSSPSKKTMSITQTYFLAHKARAKLSSEAARPDHNLRLLVGHANLLDGLMLDLADAEREQESWFNQSVKTASPKADERHIQWADSIPEQDEEEEDWEADSSDSESESDDEDIEMADAIPLTRIASHSAMPASPQIQTIELEEEEEEDDEEDFASLSLTRTTSHSNSSSPPELDHDEDSSEDESMPPSPPSNTMPTFSEKQQKDTDITELYDSRQHEDDKSFYEDGYYLPPRNPARLISAISVY